MQFRPMPAYVFIKISRKEQEKKKQKIGSILIPETHTFMMYNLQAGEIVSIGQDAHAHFPEMKAAQTILVHHFVQGADDNEAREDHLIGQDEDYNYYAVTVFDFHRKGNETYGIWDGEKIIPNKNYIFLEPPIRDAPNTPDEYINSAIKKTPGGLFAFSNWTESRESKAEKMQRLKGEIEQLSKSGISNPQIKRGIQEKEAELGQMSLDVNCKQYVPFTIAAFNPELKEHFHESADINIGSKIWMLNIAAQTEIEFNGRTYIVAKTNYIGCADNMMLYGGC